MLISPVGEAPALWAFTYSGGYQPPWPSDLRCPFTHATRGISSERAVAARQNDVVAYDIGEQTVKVVTEGLPALPDRFEPSQTLPVALWRGERNGAVLFVRLWRNGNYDSDCAI